MDKKKSGLNFVIKRGKKLYIKIANQNDINTLIDITQNAREVLDYPESYKEKFQEYLIKKLLNNEFFCKRITYIYYQNNTALGYISFTCLENSTVEVNNLFVNSDIQNRGIGTQLLNECEKIANKFGTKLIKIASEPKSINFYFKHKYILTDDFLNSAVFSDVKYPYVIKYL